MTHYSSYLADEEVELLLVAVYGASYLSKRDNCRVALVKCTKCGRSFEEEVQSAMESISGREDFLCLGCDPAGVKPAFVGLTLQIGWEAE